RTEPARVSGIIPPHLETVKLAATPPALKNRRNSDHTMSRRWGHAGRGAFRGRAGAGGLLPNRGQPSGIRGSRGPPSTTSRPGRCVVSPPVGGQTTLTPTTDSAHSPTADAPRSSDCRTVSTPADPTPRPTGATDCHAPTTGSG